MLILFDLKINKARINHSGELELGCVPITKTNKYQK